MNDNAPTHNTAESLMHCRDNINRHWHSLSQSPSDEQAHTDFAHDIHHLASSGTHLGCEMLGDLAGALAQALTQGSLDSERQLKFIKGEVDQLLAVMDQAIEDAMEAVDSSDHQHADANNTAPPAANDADDNTQHGSQDNKQDNTQNTLQNDVTDSATNSASGHGMTHTAPPTNAASSTKKIYMSEHPREITHFVEDGSTLPHERKVVYVVEDDPALSEHLLNELGHFHYEARTIPDLKTLKAVMQKEVPNVAVVDVRMPDGKTTDFFKKVKEDYPNLPLIFTSAIDDIRSRVAAVEAGGQYFLKKPAEINRLVQLIDRLVQPHATDPIRIMIVPNQTAEGEKYAKILYDAGCVVSIVDNPWRLFTSAEQLQPDVILLSATYQQCDGHTLAEALRQEDDFVSTPLMFIPDAENAEAQLHQGSIGSDGFLHDTTAPELLVAEVVSKAKHHRQLLDVIARDSLTGAHTHAAIAAQVHRDFHHAQLNDDDYSVAIIDIDSFRLINERHGHNAGDRLLCRLTHFLRKHLDPEVTIGRYSGEEFLLSLPETTGAEALQQIDRLRQIFSDTCQIAKTKMKHTFSAGVADFPTYDSVSELLYYADQALYEAKRTGKNNVKQV